MQTKCFELIRYVEQNEMNFVVYNKMLLFRVYALCRGFYVVQGLIIRWNHYNI